MTALPAERDASNTAVGVAAMRVAHQLIDPGPPVLDDPVIARLLGEERVAAIVARRDRFATRPLLALRSHVVVRGRYAEDRLREARERGVARYVILGAGLDTFGYRQPAWARDLEIIEVDHEASQRVKRDLIARAGIEVPPNVRFAAIDFERETVTERLRREGLDMNLPTFFSWLGVTMYLTRDAIASMLGDLGGYRGGSQLVATFAPPGHSHESAWIARRAGSVGEPWITYISQDEMDALLRSCGFSTVEFPSTEELARRYFDGWQHGLPAPRRRTIVAAASDPRAT